MWLEAAAHVRARSHVVVALLPSAGACRGCIEQPLRPCGGLSSCMRSCRKMLSKSGPKDAMLLIAALSASVPPLLPKMLCRCSLHIGLACSLNCVQVNVSYVGIWSLGILWALLHFQDLLTKVSVDTSW